MADMRGSLRCEHSADGTNPRASWTRRPVTTVRV
jgi:hypothetical protein